MDKDYVHGLSESRTLTKLSQSVSRLRGYLAEAEAAGNERNIYELTYELKIRLRDRERAFLQYTDPFKYKYPERWAKVSEA